MNEKQKSDLIYMQQFQPNHAEGNMLNKLEIPKVQPNTCICFDCKLPLFKGGVCFKHYKDIYG